nr:helix-turn-helix domain-containing protein [Candidatus Sigynarchaeum springense]
MLALQDQLIKLGLSKYESMVYTTLLRFHLNSATMLAEKSGVPRTKIYQVLESLQEKGWIKVYSGAPLLFKASQPDDVIERIRKEQDTFLTQVQEVLKEEANIMKEKFVILKMDIGIENLKDEIRKAKTVWVSNATTDFIRRINDAFRDDAQVRVVLFPGEQKTDNFRIEWRESLMKVVKIYKGQEVPSISVILDEERTFSVLEDPKTLHYVVDEMLYDECTRCFVNFYNLGFNNAKEA